MNSSTISVNQHPASPGSEHYRRFGNFNWSCILKRNTVLH